MNYLEYGLFSGGFVNRFLTAGVFLQDSPFQKTAFEGRVNEWLIKGSSIHDNPYRAKVIQGRMGNIPPVSYTHLDVYKRQDIIPLPTL